MLLTIVALLAAAQPSATAAKPMCQFEAADPALLTILPLKARAVVQDGWLKERLDTIVPTLIRSVKTMYAPASSTSAIWAKPIRSLIDQ